MRSAFSLALAVPLSLYASIALSQTAPPEGARQLKYTKTLFDVRPARKDVSRIGTDNNKFYMGQWYTTRPYSIDGYNDENGALAISQGSEISSARRDSRPGALPLLSGQRGFYVEFTAWLSDNHADHFPALWLMPIEHSARQEDKYPGDPPGYERWLEIDVDEGGFGPGAHGVAIGWKGRWPNYERSISKNGTSTAPLDRTKPHTFGVSYHPDTQTMRWWLDGKLRNEVKGDPLPEVAKKQNFYVIAGAQSHGKKVPYKLYVQRIRAYGPP